MEAGRQVGVELGSAGETEACVGNGVVHRVNVVLKTVVPIEEGAVDVTAEGEGHTAVSLARGRGFKLGHAFLEISAAVAAEVGRSSGGGAQQDPSQCGNSAMARGS